MKSQEKINNHQKEVNDEQVEINEKTKIDLSGRNFIAIIVAVVTLSITVTSAYLYNNFNTASNIRDIKTDTAWIKEQLVNHLTASDQLSAKMEKNVKDRNTEIKDLDKRLASVEYALSIKINDLSGVLK
jgi:septal ring factor EnvC (AmiA/AmiB activator)